MKRILIPAAVFFALAGLFGAALYFGWIGHRSLDWQEFRDEFSVGRFKEVHFEGRKITAYYDAPEGQPIVLYAPTDPLPLADRKWFVYKAYQRGVTVVFDTPEPGY